MLDNHLYPFLRRRGALLAFLIALTATLGSLYYSEIRHFIPCTLCWYQRILMYPLVIVTLVGLIEEDSLLPTYVLPFTVLGAVIAGYHYAIQLGAIGGETACAIGVPCSSRYVNYFGFVTIPFMALTAFALIFLTMAATQRAQAVEAD